MDEPRIAELTRSLTSVPSRRDVLRGLAGATLGLGMARLPNLAEAKKDGGKNKKRKDKLKKPKSNAYGCLNVGAACKDAGQCCSGICTGKTCRAHHEGICRVDYDLCTTGAAHICDTSGGGSPTCACLLTTGNAPFCGGTGEAITCQECSNDSDCEEGSGAGAACVVLRGVCEGLCAESGDLACVAPCADPAK